MKEQPEGHLETALRSLAAEVETARTWSRASRSLGQERIVTVFGSARTKPGDPSYELARSLGAAVAQRGWAAVTGGGPGIMQAVRDGSGELLSRAVRIEIAGEVPDTVLDPSRSITVGTFALRKLLLTHDIDALFVFPGGVGTLDELYDVLVHQDTDQHRPFPVILMQPDGVQLWDAWLRFMTEHLVRTGLVSPSIMSQVAIADSVEDALALADKGIPADRAGATA
ncbi:TIGR00730 family Rossman fold protein [Streptomyces sp. NPDC058145]|uniref:LOG family protein n=1 Tax=Streptomyces sp. NPDC058145 TaxID=3346356 RepID=UPI0036E08BBE